MSDVISSSTTEAIKSLQTQVIESLASLKVMQANARLANDATTSNQISQLIETTLTYLVFLEELASSPVQYESVYSEIDLIRQHCQTIQAISNASKH